MSGIIKRTIKKEPVLVASWILAFLSALLVPVDKMYITYIDYRTLCLLFCLMAVTEGFKDMGIFKAAGSRLVSNVKNTFQVEAALVFICFFSSMIITNDVSLITFVPFAIETLRLSGMENRVMSVVVMQTIAANLGSIITPIGNPQNIFIYTKYSISLPDFFLTMLPYGIISLILISAVLAVQKKENINLIHTEKPAEISDKRLLPVYSLLFILSMLTVGRLLSAKVLFAVSIISITALDRKTLKKVDYSLLLTFAGFFIFIGNIGRIGNLQSLFKSFIQGNEVISAVVSSQIISNVPSALLLSGFTSSWRSLLIGVNIGGLGTLIASMASLISYKLFCVSQPESSARYLRYFSVVNFIFLIAMLLIYCLINSIM